MRISDWSSDVCSSDLPGLVPDATFFEHLANRRFPATCFIRTREQLDYLEEPDAFHDVFGHVPLLLDPVLADYMQEYGKGGLRSEERRVGKECVSKCRSRGSQGPYKKKSTKTNT